MRYLRVQWLHGHADEPVEIYSELDDAGWEIRKVEIFRDGSIGFASASEAGGTTVLGEEAVPALEDIGTDPQFKPSRISKEEFERRWNGRHTPVSST
jgi:hypothetical protein